MSPSKAAVLMRAGRLRAGERVVSFCCKAAIGMSLSLALCGRVSASPAHLACDGTIVYQYPSEKPPEPQALSITLDEDAGTVRIAHWGTAKIKSGPGDNLVRFVDDGADGFGVLWGSIDRFNGAFEFRLIGSLSKEPLMNYHGRCKSARPVF
jgi:hypothetical protein